MGRGGGRGAWPPRTWPYLSEMMRPCRSSSFKFTPKHEENKICLQLKTLLFFSKIFKKRSYDRKNGSFKLYVKFTAITKLNVTFENLELSRV